MDLDQAPHCMGPDLGSSLFDLMIQFLQKSRMKVLSITNYLRTIYHTRITRRAKSCHIQATWLSVLEFVHEKWTSDVAVENHFISRDIKATSAVQLRECCAPHLEHDSEGEIVTILLYIHFGYSYIFKHGKYNYIQNEYDYNTCFVLWCTSIPHCEILWLGFFLE